MRRRTPRDLFHAIFREIRMGSQMIKFAITDCTGGVGLTKESTELHPKEDEPRSKGDSKGLDCCSNFVLGRASVAVENG
jgi:hypothetical protein